MSSVQTVIFFPSEGVGLRATDSRTVASEAMPAVVDIKVNPPGEGGYRRPKVRWFSELERPRIDRKVLLKKLIIAFSKFWRFGNYQKEFQIYIRMNIF